MNIVEFYRMDPNNIGDWYSNPCRYFFENKDTIKIDLDNVRKTSWHQNDTLIVGGGGLIGNDNFELLMNRICTHPDESILTDILETKLKTISQENKELLYRWKERIQKLTLDTLNSLDKTVGPRILWGAGYNSKDLNIIDYSVDYPKYLNQFHLVGIRDWDAGYRWVPCASCMHPAFDKEYEIKNEIVWFEHKKRIIDNRSFDLIPAPRMINSGQNFEQIIDFLGSAETVVTNSYHGVYWATLLGRKVICIPWGSKFNMFRHPPTMANEKNWPSNLEKTISYPNSLEECRTANLDFFQDVKSLIEEKSEK